MMRLERRMKGMMRMAAFPQNPPAHVTEGGAGLVVEGGVVVAARGVVDQQVAWYWIRCVFDSTSQCLTVIKLVKNSKNLW